MSSEQVFLKSGGGTCNSLELTDIFSFERPGPVMLLLSVSLLKEHVTAQRRHSCSWEDFGEKF